MKINKFKSSLTAFVVASTLFGAYTRAYGFENLGTAENGSNSGVVSPATGYNFIDSNVAFNIQNGHNIGTTGNVSIDNNNGLPGSAFANTRIVFLGDSTVAGDIGPSNKVESLVLATPAFQTVVLQGNVVNAGSFSIATEDPNIGILALDNAGMIFTADVTRSASGFAVVNILQSATVNGDLGLLSSGNKLNSINLDGLLALNGNIYADNVQFKAAVGINVMAGNHNIRSPITTGTDGEGFIQFQQNVNSVISEPIGTNVNRLFFVGLQADTTNVRVDTDFIAAKELFVSRGVLTINSNLDLDAQTTIAEIIKLMPDASVNVQPTANNDFKVLTSGVTPHMQFDMAGDFSRTGVINGSTMGKAQIGGDTIVDIINPAYSVIPQSTAIVIDNQDAGANLPATLTVNENSFLSDFFVTKVGNVLELEIQSTPVSTIATQSNVQGLAETLDLIALTGSTGSLFGLVQQLGYFTTLEDLLIGLNTLAPIVDGALMQQSFEMQSNVFGYVNERMDRLSFWRNHLGRGHLGSTGFASGDGWYDQWDKGDKGLWLKLWRQHANQQEIDGLPGYKSNTWGLVGGFDSTLNETLLIGGALSYGFSEVHHHISDHAETKINSIQATLYGSLDCYTPWFFNGQLGLAYNHYDLHRTIDFGAIFLRPDADTDAWQLGLNTEVGYVIDYGIVHLIPSASLFYSHLWLDGYEEGNAGTASLTYEKEEFDTLLLGIGANVAKDYVYKLKLIQPAIHAYYYYDFLNDKMEVTSAFAGFGPDFTTSGVRPDRNSFRVGASLSVYTLKNSLFEINYDYGFKVDDFHVGDYQTHTGFIKWRIALP